MFQTELKEKEITVDPSSSVLIVLSRFNEEITEALLNGAKQAFQDYNVSQTDVYSVPGAYEIPLAIQKGLETGRYQAAVALGAVIRGDTPHFDYVCQAVNDGITRLTLETGYPIAFGILTTDNINQAKQRCQPNKTNKGYEAACVSLEMIDLCNRIRQG